MSIPFVQAEKELQDRATEFDLDPDRAYILTYRVTGSVEQAQKAEDEIIKARSRNADLTG